MRPVESWLPPIDNLCKTIEKAVKMIQHTDIELKSGEHQIFNSNSSLTTFDEAIAFRKRELKYLKQLLSNCQNSMHSELAESQSKLTNQMKTIDAEIEKYERLYRNNFSNQPNDDSIKQQIINKINQYNGRIASVSKKIHKSRKRLRHNQKVHTQHQINLNLIRKLKHKKLKLSKKEKQTNQKSGNITSQKNSNLTNSKVNKVKNLLNGSIKALKSRLSLIDNDNLETKTQLNQIKSLIRLNQEQLLNIKKCTNETVSKTAQKTHFIANVVDEMKNLQEIRKTKSEIADKITNEKTKCNDLKDKICSINEKIKKIKLEKQKVLDEYYIMEEHFLYETLPKRQHPKTSKRNQPRRDTHEFSDDYNDNSIDADENEAIRIENQRIIKEKQESNAKLFKSLERKNAQISAMRHTLRELRDQMAYNAKIKKERAEAKQKRINHSVFFSFDKLLTQIKEKEDSILSLRQKIKEKKEFLKEYSQYEEMIKQFDNPYSRYS